MVASLGSRRLFRHGGPGHIVRAAAFWGCSGRREVGSKEVRLVPVDNLL
jgi:hypothetical protein